MPGKTFNTQSTEYGNDHLQNKDLANKIKSSWEIRHDQYIYLNDSILKAKMPKQTKL